MRIKLENGRGFCSLVMNRTQRRKPGCCSAVNRTRRKIAVVPLQQIVYQYYNIRNKNRQIPLYCGKSRSFTFFDAVTGKVTAAQKIEFRSSFPGRCGYFLRQLRDLNGLYRRGRFLFCPDVFGCHCSRFLNCS